MSDTFIADSSNEEQISNSTNEVENQEQPFLTVGERVFKTKEDVMNNISHAQEHIKKVEDSYEKAVELIAKQEEALSKSSRVEELMEAFAKRKESSGQDEATPSINKEDVIADALKAFDQLQNERKSQDVSKKNWDEVTSTLTVAYGDKTNEVVRKVAEENDLTWEEAVSMAKTKPRVFLRMFDLTTKTTATVNRSSMNTDAVGTEHNKKPRKNIMQMSARDRMRYVQDRLSEFTE